MWLSYFRPTATVPRKRQHSSPSIDGFPIEVVFTKMEGKKMKFDNYSKSLFVVLEIQKFIFNSRYKK